MQQNVLVSVIIPSYNYGNFIVATLNSIKIQTHEHWEAIIVDDGSTDNTRDLVLALAEKDTRIIYVYQENKGLSAARNTGIEHSSGHFIQFLDADDLISEDKFKIQLAHFASDASLGISYTEVYYFTNDKTQEKYKTLDLRQREWMVKLKDSPASEQLRRLIDKNIMPVNSPLIKKEVVEKVGDFNIELTSLEDWEYWFRSAMHFKIGYVENEKAYCLIRVHHTSMSNNLRKMYLNELAVRSLFRSYIIENIVDASERKILLKKNDRLIKRPNSYFIREAGFFNFKNASQIIKSYGLTQFIRAYLKAANDARKKNIS